MTTDDQNVLDKIIQAPATTSVDSVTDIVNPVKITNTPSTPAASSPTPVNPSNNYTYSPAAERKIVEDLSPKSDDEEILKFLEETKQKIFIVGAGGSGTNTLDRLFELGVEGVTTVAMNTDAKHLLRIRANKKMILGKKLTAGRGAGSNPVIGEEAAKESLNELKQTLSNASLVFITCGMGGGTGTGSAPVIAEQAKLAGALTVCVVTLPFISEGRVRLENALKGLEKLKKFSDTVIVIKNDKLLNLVPDLPLNTAFKVCDEILAGSVKGVAELVTKSGLVNVDFADLRTILSSGGYAVIGLGEASVDAKHEDRARIAVEAALNSPLLDADISSATKALINVVGGEDMTLKEAEYVVAETARRINPNAHIIWGARIENHIKKSSMRILVVLAGVKFPRYDLNNPSAIENFELDLIG
ncbi:MAG: cell division protein FtsZ [Candidatus Micrarchaeota archaeon]